MNSKNRQRILIVLALSWLMLTPFISSVHQSNTHMTPVSTIVLAAPTITGPTYYEFENGSVGHTLKYETSDPNPDRYLVERDGVEYDSGIWSGGQLTVFLVYLYTEQLIDTLPKDFVFNVTVINDSDEATSILTDVHVYADVRAPIVAQPLNITYEEGSFGNEILWNITESNPDFYNVSRISSDPTANFTNIISGNWDGSNISMNVDNLNVSRWYLYTLFVNDTLGFNTTSHVNVTVVPDLSFPALTSPDDIAYEFGAQGFAIEWHAYDSNPKNYTITALITYNDTSYGPSGFHTWIEIIEADWTFTNPDGQDIIASLDQLYLGNYSITLSVYDDYDRLSMDTVNVTVYEDVRAPIIASTGDIIYEEGYSGYSIEWGAEESNPVLFNLTRGNEILANGTWNGENYTISVDNLDVGVYFYNMTYTDYFNQSASEVVRIEVSPDAHLPIVSELKIIQAMTSPSKSNLTVQAYVWDLNNISSIEVQWGVGNPDSPDFEPEVADMVNTEPDDFYQKELGEFTRGTVVWYRVLATDNSSVSNVFERSPYNPSFSACQYISVMRLRLFGLHCHLDSAPFEFHGLQVLTYPDWVMNLDCQN